MALGFDWPGLIRVGLTGLGLTPEVFWGLTPLELRIMLGAGQGVPPLTREGLAALLRAYPDEVDTEGGARRGAHGRDRDIERRAGAIGAALGGNGRDDGGV